MRRKILHQFKYYLRNQTEHRKKINDDAYALWKRAKHLLESEVAWECKDKMSLTTFRQKTIDAIFDLATKACASIWEEYWQKMTKRPKPQDIESRVERFARNKHFIDRPDIVDAYRATLNGDPFIYSTYAQSIGVRCDQENGVLTIGRTNLNIPARSEVAWTIIRLFVSSNDPKGITVLYPGWDGTFSKNVNNDKNKFRSLFTDSEANVFFNISFDAYFQVEEFIERDLPNFCKGWFRIMPYNGNCILDTVDPVGEIEHPFYRTAPNIFNIKVGFGKSELNKEIKRKNGVKSFEARRPDVTMPNLGSCVCNEGDMS